MTPDARIHVSLAHLRSLQGAARGLSFLPRQPSASVLNGRHASRLRGRGLNFEEMRGYEKTRAMHHVDSIHDATTRILEKARHDGTNPHLAAVNVAEQRMKLIGDLRRFRRHGDDRN